MAIKIDNNKQAVYNYIHKTTKLSHSTGIGVSVANNGLFSLNVCETVELKNAVTKCPKEINVRYEFK